MSFYCNSTQSSIADDGNDNLILGTFIDRLNDEISTTNVTGFSYSRSICYQRLPKP